MDINTKFSLTIDGFKELAYLMSPPDDIADEDLEDWLYQVTSGHMSTYRTWMAQLGARGSMSARQLSKFAPESPESTLKWLMREYKRGRVQPTAMMEMMPGTEPAPMPQPEEIDTYKYQISEHQPKQKWISTEYHQIEDRYEGEQN